jgi:hypothetical protein
MRRRRCLRDGSSLPVKANLQNPPRCALMAFSREAEVDVQTGLVLYERRTLRREYPYPSWKSLFSADSSVPWPTLRRLYDSILFSAADTAEGAVPVAQSLHTDVGTTCKVVAWPSALTSPFGHPSPSVDNGCLIFIRGVASGLLPDPPAPSWERLARWADARGRTPKGARE